MSSTESDEELEYTYTRKNLVCHLRKNSVKIWKNYLATIFDPVNNSNTRHLNVPKGIEPEGPFKIKTLDKCGLIKMLRKVHPWIRKEIYMGPQKEVLQKFNVSPGNAAVVLTNYTACYNKSTNAWYRKLLFRLHLDSYIFEMPFPKLTSSCSDYYVPLRFQPIENWGTQDIKDKTVINSGLGLGKYWPPKETEDCSSVHCKHIRLPDNDPFMLHVVHEILNFFVKRGISNTTNLTWNREMLITNGSDQTKRLINNRFNYYVDFTFPLRSRVEVYGLVGSCGQYQIDIIKLFTRIYDLNMTCIGKQNPEGIEDCKYCPNKATDSFTGIDIFVLKNAPC